MEDIDNDNITTSEEEVKLSLKQQIRELKKQLNELKPYKDKLPLDPDYFCKYQKKIYDEKLGKKVPCELCGRMQTLKHLKDHQKKPICLRNRKSIEKVD